MRTNYSVEDSVPVPAERFAQWVIEDNFTDGRPALEQVGVEIVGDVAPYELIKLRLLNAGHQVIAYYGLLLGHHRVPDAMADPLIIELLRRFWATEARPTLAPIPGIDFSDYCTTLEQRFANVHVADTLARLAAYGSDRISAFLVPVVRDNVAHHRPTTISAAVTASWLRTTEITPERPDNRRGTPEELMAEILDGLPTGFLEDVRAGLDALRTGQPAVVLRNVLSGNR